MRKRILFAVLDWGLGHATRSAAVAECLTAQGAEVIFFSWGKSLQYLIHRFPAHEVRALPLPEISYGRSSASPALIGQALRQIGQNKAVHRYIKDAVEKLQPDAVLSDNVYGAHARHIPSVLITHQLSLPVPAFSGAVNRVLTGWLDRFSEIWVPDRENGIAGTLSTNRHYTGKVHHLGNLSRLRRPDPLPEKIYTCTAVISGPEPLRSSFEQEALRRLETLSGKKALIRGVQAVDGDKFPEREEIEVVNFADGEALSELISASEYVICRAGFSTLSDLVRLSAKALIVPTPGQYEQEYLADRAGEKDWFAAVRALPDELPPPESIPQPPAQGDVRLREVAENFLRKL